MLKKTSLLLLMSCTVAISTQPQGSASAAVSPSSTIQTATQAGTVGTQNKASSSTPALVTPGSPALAIPPAIQAALKIETIAEQAILIDHKTGIVLFEKNADQLVHPSSMTKLLTAYMMFKLIKSGTIQLDSMIQVSQAAWKMGGSKMFLSLDSQVSVEDLLRGIIIQSGNDACVAAAEGTMGTEQVFAAAMTQLAHEWGAKNSTFKNASGWPDPEHLTTVRDLSIILRHIIDDYPQYHHIFQQREYIYNNIRQYNRNPLLYKNVNCDVGKTGFTDRGGYGLAASATENNMRVDMVINGTPNNAKRSEEAVKLMTWALKTFDTYTIYRKGQLVETAPVWLGTEDVVPLTVLEDCVITVPRVAYKDIKVEIRYNSPIEAPLSKNTEVGHVILSAPTLSTPIQIPLVAAAPIDRAGFLKKISLSIRYLIWGKTS